jgi:hypothetical protein
VTVVRVTATGAALATITVPRPYGTFIGVTAAADNRTFVLAAQELARLPLRTPPATRFFLLRIDPASRVPASRAQLTPLPIPEQHTGPRRLSAGPAGQPVSTAADRQRHPARPHRRLLQPRAQCRYPRQRPLHPHPVVQPHLRGRLAALTPEAAAPRRHRSAPPRHPIWCADCFSLPIISPLDAEYPPICIGRVLRASPLNERRMGFSAVLAALWRICGEARQPGLSLLVTSGLGAVRRSAPRRPRLLTSLVSVKAAAAAAVARVPHLAAAKSGRRPKTPGRPCDADVLAHDHAGIAVQPT